MSDDPRAHFPTARLGEILASEPLTLGLSGAHVHAVTTSTGTYVIRHQPADGATFARALPYHRLASRQGIAPRLVHVDEVAHCTVSERVEGILFAQALASPKTRASAMASLVGQLAALHAIPVDDASGGQDPVAFARDVWNEQSGRLGFPAWGRALGRRLDDASRALAADPRRVFSHGDLNPANMLWDGARVWLVDWDRAGLAHPYLDLAVVATFLSLADEVALELLAAGERAPLSPEQKRTFFDLRDLARLTYGCVFLGMVPDLRGVVPSTRESAPTLGVCYARMQAGSQDNGTPEGQALMGCALLREVV